MKIRSVTQLTKALHREGMPKEYSVVRGEGYFYFIGPGTEMWPTSSVWVFTLNQLTVAGWLKEFNTLSTARG